jgi:probable rRNA maturation factor
MGVDVTWDAGPPLLPDAEVARAVEVALAYGRRSGLEVGVVFVDDATLAGLHGDWLDDPSTTDVLAFDLGPEGGGPAAEIYVSVDRARSEATARGIPLEHELQLYLVHGSLHLCGFDDREPAARRRMRAAEGAVLRRLALDRA